MPTAPTTALIAILAFAGSAPVAQPSPAWPDLSVPAPEQGEGSNDAAVIVGISDYAFVPDVPGATTNAEDWYTYLTVTRGVPAQRVRLLRDSEGSAEEILAATQRAARQAAKGGRVWFVFIGHGAPSRAGDDGLLIAVDAQQTANSLETRSLRQSQVIAALEQSEAVPIVVLDACFSGKASDGTNLAVGLQPLRIAELAPSRSAIVLTAAKSDQYAGELPTMSRPAFSYLLLGAIRGWGDENGDGRVTAGEAVTYAESSMLTVISGRTQTPELHGTNADVVLSQAVEAGPDLREIALGRSLAPLVPVTSRPVELEDRGPPPLSPADQKTLRAKGRESTGNPRRLVIAGSVLTAFGVGSAGLVVGGAVWARRSEQKFRNDPSQREKAGGNGATANGLIIGGAISATVLGAIGVPLIVVGRKQKREIELSAGLTELSLEARF